MKHPYFCAGLVFILSLTTVDPMVRLNAAELWNTQSGDVPSSSLYNGSGTSQTKSSSSSSSGGGYYNVPKTSTAVNRATLYNTENTVMDSQKRPGGLNYVKAYNDVKMTEQTTSKQWKNMSGKAIASRQADIDLALQMEYETRKDTAKYMTKVYAEVQAAYAEGDRKHKEAVAAYEAEQEAKELERQRKKEWALSHKYSSGKASSSSSTGSSSSYTAKPSSSSTGLKKPTRLFNDPNE